jgi:hypothetical protein
MDIANMPEAAWNLLAPYLDQGGEELSTARASGEIADLEISLHRRAGSAYSVETRFTAPGSASETRLGANEVIQVEIEAGVLDGYAKDFDWTGYGRSLSAALFGSEPVKMAFGQALARAGTGPLRLRLLFGPTAPELHRLHWETLRNPLDDSLLAANQNIHFSRYLAGGGGREASPRPRAAVKVLAAAADPTDLAEYGLGPVDAPGELKRLRESWKGARVDSLPDETEACTLAGLVRRLQDGYDVLYLTAHGSLARGQAWLWLEDEDGLTARLSGVELARQMGQLDRPPLLVVLASCESAGNNEGDALQALGPLICEAGVPAVIAMQGKISMQSVARGMPVLFEKLQQDGRVDRAMASARAALAAAEAPDIWMPALFMRLKDGAIWQLPKDEAPAPAKKLWGLITGKFAGKAAAEGALEEVLNDAKDPDNRQAFLIQLKKALKEDARFAGEVGAILEADQKNAGIVINVGGNYTGNLVIGSGNTTNN